MRTTLILLIAALALFFGGCVKEVRPWEKETLAKDTMKEGGPNALLRSYQEHTYTSKEASKGGGGVAGGGCGCN